MNNLFLAFPLFFLSLCYADRSVASAFLWDASTDTLGRVVTGSSDENSGYWYDYNDEYDEGQSHFIWPSDVRENDVGNFYGPLIQMYEGIQGSFALVKGKGFSNPYVGLGFNIWSEDQEGVDITEWGGLCVEYESTENIFLAIPFENAYEWDYIEWGYTLKKSNSIVLANISWNEFRPSVICCREVPKTEELVTNVVAIKLVFSGPDSTSGDFKITKIGSLGTCDGSVPVEPVAMPRVAASVPAAQFRKVSDGFEVLDRSLVGKPYMLFDLNGVQIQSGGLPAVVKTPTAPAILRVRGKIFYLR